MTHLERLVDQKFERRLDTTLVFSLVKDLGYYPSILYCYLMEKQIEQHGIGDSYNKRRGIKWIPMLSEMGIYQNVAAFPDVRTVSRAAEALEQAGHIKTERTGAFLDRGDTGKDGYVTGKARDKWPWWVVIGMTKDYTKRATISSLEAATYGFAGAVILAHWRKAETVFETNRDRYKKLSATELEKVLPMDERTIRRQLKELIKAGALLQHAKQPKLYTMTFKEITATVETPSVPLKVLPKPSGRMTAAAMQRLIDAQKKQADEVSSCAA